MYNKSRNLKHGKREKRKRRGGNDPNGQFSKSTRMSEIKEPHGEPVGVGEEKGGRILALYLVVRLSMCLLVIDFSEFKQMTWQSKLKSCT